MTLADDFHERTGRCLSGDHSDCMLIEHEHNADRHARCLPAECRFKAATTAQSIDPAHTVSGLTEDERDALLGLTAWPTLGSLARQGIQQALAIDLAYKAQPRVSAVQVGDTRVEHDASACHHPEGYYDDDGSMGGSFIEPEREPWLSVDLTLRAEVVANREDEGYVARIIASGPGHPGAVLVVGPGRPAQDLAIDSVLARLNLLGDRSHSHGKIA